MRNEKIFDNLAWRVHRAGVRPDHLTYLQAPFMAALAYTGYRHWLLAFAALQVLIIVIDGADGILARRTGTTTRRGHLLDSIFDILGIGVTLGVVVYLHSQYAAWAYGLLLVNFLVYIQNEIQGTKSVTYTRGPVTVGLLLEPYYDRVLLAGLVIPLAIGLGLMVTRVAWRKRLWNWYQFLTAGRRREYKAVPRGERAELGGPPPGSPPLTRTTARDEARAPDVTRDPSELAK